MAFYQYRSSAQRNANRRTAETGMIYETRSTRSGFRRGYTTISTGRYATPAQRQAARMNKSSGR